MVFRFWYGLKDKETKELVLGWLSNYTIKFIEVDNEGILKFDIRLNYPSDMVAVMCDLGEDLVMFGDCVNPILTTTRTYTELGL